MKSPDIFGGISSIFKVERRFRRGGVLLRALLRRPAFRGVGQTQPDLQGQVLIS